MTATVTFTPATPPPPDPLPEGFARELGGRMAWMAFAQPVAQMAYWAEVGVNVMDSWSPAVDDVGGYDYNNMASFGAPHIAAAETWDAGAIAAGLKIARHPFTAARATADLAEPMRSNVVGWSVYDEAEVVSFDIGPQLAMLDAADPGFTMVRAMNNTGVQVVYQGDELFPYYEQLGVYPAVQIGFDWYPVQQNGPGASFFLGSLPSGLLYTATVNSLGLVSSRKAEWDIGGIQTANPLSDASYAVFIATAGFVEPLQTELRIPTPSEVRRFIADAIVNGAEAISFFPQRFEMVSGVRTFTSHNATPIEVKAELISVIANWKALETGFATNLLLDPATNRKWPATYRVCPDTSPSSQQTTAESGLTFAAPPTADFLPGPFQGSKRVTSIGDVYLIQNMMDEVASLTDATWGFSAVSFAARETLAFIEGDMVNAVWSDIDGVL